MDLLPLDIWYIIFSSDLNVFYLGLQLNREFHDFLVTCVLPVYQKRDPSAFEIVSYILNCTNLTNNPVFFGCEKENLGWKEIEFIDNKCILHTYSPDIIVETITPDRIADTITSLINCGYHLDPLTYRDVIACRGSCLRYVCDYIDSATTLYVHALLKKFDTLPTNRRGALKWKLINRAVTSLISVF